MTLKPPKPAAREGRVSLWRYARLFREDILSAQPARLYRAWMAEFKTPFFRSFLVNQPELVTRVLRDCPADFPKSGRIAEGLRPLLGDSVFLTNGAAWEAQRRIIDPAFEGGRVRDTFPAMWSAAQAMLARLEATNGAITDIEPEASHAAADVIFRTLFSIPITDDLAGDVYEEFQRYQRLQPLLNLAAILPLPGWMPRLFRPGTRASADRIRALITQLVSRRATEITQGTAPQDLATQIMTRADPHTGETFSEQEMVDQVAIFFLAGHETSASALGWALYLLATHPDWQDRVASEAEGFTEPELSALTQMTVTRDVFREALRLYPPVPMMVRTSSQTQTFRDRDVPQGAQIVISPWHLHRHTRLWDCPDDFDPGRWHTENGKTCQRHAFIPFSAGPRICPGAGFAMIEGPLLLARIVRQFKVLADPEDIPIPVAHLTVRSKTGIRLRFVRR